MFEINHKWLTNLNTGIEFSVLKLLQLNKNRKVFRNYIFLYSTVFCLGRPISKTRIKLKERSTCFL